VISPPSGWMKPSSFVLISIALASKCRWSTRAQAPYSLP
jgi:hypothetical protein